MENAEDAAKEASAENEKLLEVDLHEDRTKEFKTPSFTRMQTDWDGPNGDHVRGLMAMADNQMLTHFGGAYILMNDLYDVVRECETDENGEILKDSHGFNIWKRNEHGFPIEDWTRLTLREREHFISRITAYLTEWEQKAADLWGEAMFAKAFYEETFALGFENATGPGRSTVDAKNNAGKLSARQQRYFGIFKSLMSRKADALCRSMGLLCQRLKDTM